MSNENMENKEKKCRLLIILLCIGIAVCFAVMVWALFFRTPGGSFDYAPDKLEPNAQVIENDDSPKLEAPSGGGAISLQYEDKVTIVLSDKKAYLNYSNPNKSTQNIVLEIVIKDQTIARSGLIKPGYQVTELPLSDGAENLLSEGVYNEDAVFKILSYDPGSGEKAVVDTMVEITVTVQKQKT